MATVYGYEQVNWSVGYDLLTRIAERNLQLVRGTGQSDGERCMRLVTFAAAADG